MHRQVALTACSLIAIVMLTACGGSSGPMKAIELSESEIAAVLVGAGLTCKDNPEVGTPNPGMEITRWDCVKEGSPDPYYDVLLYAGPGTDELPLDDFCSFLSTNARNDEVVALSAANFEMYSNSSVEVDEQLTSMEVATINKEIEPVLKAVGEGLGVAPEAPAALCS